MTGTVVPSPARSRFPKRGHWLLLPRAAEFGFQVWFGLTEGHGETNRATKGVEGVRVSLTSGEGMGWRNRQDQIESNCPTDGPIMAVSVRFFRTRNVLGVCTTEVRERAFDRLLPRHSASLLPFRRKLSPLHQFRQLCVKSELNQVGGCGQEDDCRIGLFLPKREQPAHA